MENTPFDTCYQFWTKMKDPEVQEQFADVFTTKLLEETDDAFDVSHNLVANHSYSTIRTYVWFNMLPYIFVSIMRMRVRMFMIDDLFFVIHNSKAERTNLLEKVTKVFINKVEQKCKML